MKKIVFILLLFAAFQSEAQTNRFPSIDSAKNYTLRYIRNSTMEAFTNFRLQNVTYGTLELLDSLTAISGGGGNKVDSVTISTDSLFYHVNGASFYVGSIATASAGGDTTIFEIVLDSTGQQNQRVLFSKNRKIASDDRLLFDDTNNKLVINHQNISVGGANTKLYVGGNTNITGTATVGNVATSTDTTTYKPLIIGSDGVLRKLTYWPTGGSIPTLNQVTTAGNFTNNEIRSGAGGFTVRTTGNSANLLSIYNVGNDNGEINIRSISTGKELAINHNSLSFTSGGFSQTITSFPTPSAAVTFTLPNTAINRYIPTTFKINSTTVAANDTGLVDLGTIANTTVLDNVGTGFDLAQQGTDNVKRLQAGFGIKLDSITTANTVRVSLDTTTQTLTDGATITFNANNGVSAQVTLGGNRTLAFSNFSAGVYLTLVVIQDGTGSRTLTLPAGTKVINGGAGAVTLTTAASSQDILTFFKIGTTIYCNYGKNYN